MLCMGGNAGGIGISCCRCSLQGQKYARRSKDKVRKKIEG